MIRPLLSAYHSRTGGYAYADYLGWPGDERGAHGVREYWVVNNDAGWVMVYRLQPDGRYGKPDYYLRDESVRSDAIDAGRISRTGGQRVACV